MTFERSCLRASAHNGWSPSCCSAHGGSLVALLDGVGTRVNLLKNDLETAHDMYWWAYDTFFANPTQDLELVILGHPDGTDFALVAWGVGCEELVQDAFTLVLGSGAAADE